MDKMVVNLHVFYACVKGKIFSQFDSSLIIVIYTKSQQKEIRKDSNIFIVKKKNIGRSQVNFKK